MALNQYEKELKQEALAIAGDDPKMVTIAVRRVLWRHGENEPGRKGYLWRTLVKAATATIKAVRRKHDRRAACA